MKNFSKSPSLTKIGEDDRLHSTTNAVIPHVQVAAVGMPQEDQAHHGQKIFVAGIVGIVAQCVSRPPQSFFDGFDVF